MDHQEQSIKMIEERYAAMTLEEEEADGKGVGETRVGNGQGNAADNQAENPGTENTEGEKSGVMDMDENSGSLNSNMPNKVAPGVIGGSSGNSEFEGGDDIGPNGGIIIADPKRRRIEEENDGPGIIGSMGLNQIGLSKNGQEKRVPVEGTCKVCGSDVESIYHCLIWCNFARSCWAIVGLDGVGNQYSSFQSWMEEVSNTCSEKLELAGMLCWGIWKARNELVWNSSASRAARDSAGEMIEAKARVYSGVMDSQCAEAIGIREALSWIKNEQEHAGAMRLDTQLSYIIESDCQSIVQAIKNASTMLSPIGREKVKCSSQPLALCVLQGEDFVQRFILATSTLCCNVSTTSSDFNPYSYLPSNLPDGIGYFLSSEVKKDTQFGSWKANGEPCEIFTNSVLTGWRTTFVFFEGRSPNEKKTDWVMQEYRITPKGLGDGSKAKDYGSLCRILQSEKYTPDQGINMIALLKSNSTGGQGSKSEAQENGDVEAVLLTSAEKRNRALRGDFLELDDLADPQSPLSSSFNSSCPTIASEEFFDSVMLLQELEDKRVDRKEQFKYTISSTVKPNEVVMRPAIVGKLTTEEPMKSNCILPALVVGGEKDGLVLECKQETEAVYSSKNASASSGHHRAVNKIRKEKKGVPGQIKKLQKFFCLDSF
ncbi:hypothetical protein POM88_005318 [Heracleum sosnowskyi]|uniref:NAC domain-containing protein n=1 Tax=Heracleum sosnowskyi TaxID=360622 RepID=A0AAD8JL12_9APIA|nr:hypothetical protein POM88_005318 [Heracleum sosnowskyi]